MHSSFALFPQAPLVSFRFEFVQLKLLTLLLLLLGWHHSCRDATNDTLERLAEPALEPARPMDCINQSALQLKTQRLETMCRQGLITLRDTAQTTPSKSPSTKRFD
jgi:hypothetical protein